jgi:tyrosine-protein kinase Etk/Wzc
MTKQAMYRTELVESEQNNIDTEREENPIVLAVLLSSLYRGRKVVATTTLIAFLAAVAAAFLIAPRYTSKASFIPPSSSNSSTAAALAGQLSQLSGLGSGALMGGIKSPGDLYVGILKSRRVASELVRRFDLKNVYGLKKDSLAQKRLASNTSFEIGLKDSIVTISVTDKSPTRARDMANTYLDLLREANGNLALTESSQRRLFFGQQLLKEKDALAAAEVDLKKTEETSGFVAPATQTAAEIQMIANTRAQIAVRQVELSALRQSATEQNPNVIRLQSEINGLEGQLSHLQSGVGKSGGGGLPTSKLPGIALDYVRKSREVKYHEVLFEMLSRQYEAARIDEARESPLLQILDTASYPDAKSFPPRMLMILAGIVLGFLVGASLVLLRERFAEFVQSLRSNN